MAVAQKGQSLLRLPCRSRSTHEREGGGGRGEGIVPEFRGGRKKKAPPRDRFDQIIRRMSSFRGKFAYHLGDHGVPSPRGTVLRTFPWTRTSNPHPIVLIRRSLREDRTLPCVNNFIRLTDSIEQAGGRLPAMGPRFVEPLTDTVGYDRLINAHQHSPPDTWTASQNHRNIKRELPLYTSYIDQDGCAIALSDGFWNLVSP